MDQERLVPPLLRRKGTSRSFTDLRTVSKEQSQPQTQPPRMQRNMSFGPGIMNGVDGSDGSLAKGSEKSVKSKSKNDAEEMKSRSSQKTFVLVRVGRYNLFNDLIPNDC
jgi:hypothetical protein